MSMNYKEVVKGLPEEEVVKYASGIRVVHDVADSLQRQGLLPEWFTNNRLQIPEQPIEIRTFTDKQKLALGKAGFVVYLLTGQSISLLREVGKPFWATWHQDYPDLENFPSRLSEIAINSDPKKFFLPESNNKTLDQQLRLVEGFSRKLTAKISGVKAILGESPDYIELTFTHLDQTGDRLFGKKYGYNYTRTITRVGSYSVDVGNFSAGYGLSVHDWYADNGFDGLWAAPLVVPIDNR